jgi:hypothetical protein
MEQSVKMKEASLRQREEAVQKQAADLQEKAEKFKENISSRQCCSSYLNRTGIQNNKVFV